MQILFLNIVDYRLPTTKETMPINRFFHTSYCSSRILGTIHKSNKAAQNMTRLDKKVITKIELSLRSAARIAYLPSSRLRTRTPRAVPPAAPAPDATWRRRQPADKQLWLNKYRPCRLRDAHINRWILIRLYLDDIIKFWTCNGSEMACGHGITCKWYLEIISVVADVGPVCSNDCTDACSATWWQRYKFGWR